MSSILNSGANPLPAVSASAARQARDQARQVHPSGLRIGPKPATSGGGKCSLSVNAYGVGPDARKCSTRSSASSVIGVWPRGIHHWAT